MYRVLCIVDKIENQLVILPEWLVVDVGTNNLLNDINLLNNIKKIFSKANKNQQITNWHVLVSSSEITYVILKTRYEIQMLQSHRIC